MGSILSGQSGFQSALGQQVPGQSTQQAGSVSPIGNGQVIPYSSSFSNPFMQAGSNSSSTYDPNQYQTGFNGGTGSYNFMNSSIPSLTANTANAGQQTTSTGQMATGAPVPGGLIAQTQGNTQAAGAQGGAFDGNQFMQQLMQMFGQMPQFQNSQAPGATTPNPAQQVTQPTTPHVAPTQQPTVAPTGGAGWTQGTGLNSKLQNQGFNTGSGQNNMYQEMYNPKTQQYSFSNPYLHDLGGTASTAAGAEQLYNQKYSNDAINTGITSGLNYGGT